MLGKKQQPQRAKNDRSPPRERDVPERPETDKVEEASEESFPASDAPGWNSTSIT